MSRGPLRRDLLAGGCFAGAMIACNRPLSGFPTGDWHDHRVDGYFVGPQPQLSRGDALPKEFWGINLPLPEKIGVRSWVSAWGDWLAIGEPDGSAQHNAWLVRQVLPYATSLQGFLTLHASCVLIGGMAHAFIGVSGLGKSTLGGHLKVLGFERVSDDQLPVRRRTDSFVSVRQPSETGVVAREVPIRSLGFLERKAGLERVERRAMSPASVFSTLLGEGFSELGDRRVWRQQFLAYDDLARNVRGYRLIIPENAKHTREFARQVATLIGGPTVCAESGI